MSFRTAMHLAGAEALSQLLRYEPPGEAAYAMPCPCGHKARYREMRSRNLLTALGEVKLTRPWYLCPHCHNGQFPVDTTLDVEKTDLSLPVCAVCWRWLVRTRRSITDAVSSNCWRDSR